MSTEFRYFYQLINVDILSTTYIGLCRLVYVITFTND